MEFTPLDLRTWNRREHFQHYLREAPCGYSLTRYLDVTERMERAKAGGRRFYPTILWAVATVCNRHAECRMALRDGAPGTYDQVVPVYTVFHEETETFSGRSTTRTRTALRRATARMPRPTAGTSALQPSPIARKTRSTSPCCRGRTSRPSS